MKLSTKITAVAFTFSILSLPAQAHPKQIKKSLSKQLRLFLQSKNCDFNEYKNGIGLLIALSKQLGRYEAETNGIFDPELKILLPLAHQFLDKASENIKKLNKLLDHSHLESELKQTQQQVTSLEELTEFLL